MALLHDIQQALLDDRVGVGSILLKLRYLSAKLGSDELGDWVKHEADGYPDDVPIPDYRVIDIMFHGSFDGGIKQINNVQIPPMLIASRAGPSWKSYPIRDSLPMIDSRLRELKDRPQGEQEFRLDASNLLLGLQGVMYPGFTLYQIVARIDTSAFRRVQHAIRSRALEL